MTNKPATLIPIGELVSRVRKMETCLKKEKRKIFLFIYLFIYLFIVFVTIMTLLI